jgi:hypothetical protein
MYRDAAGADMIGARGVRAMLTDSIEVGAANWTPKMIDQFKRLRGYDATPWLPASPARWSAAARIATSSSMTGAARWVI